MTPADILSDSVSIPSLSDTDQPLGDSSSMYKYRDFSSVEDKDLLERETQTSAPSPPPTAPLGGVETSIRVQKFPVKLYAILAQKEFHEIITWMPHGRSWKVLKPALFESLIMPLYFEYSNYHSFNRLVNAWSFRRISSGPDRGSYYHELFLRGRPKLQKYMRRLPKTHKKLPMKKDDEPDFYQMDKASPLPPLLEESNLGSQSMMQQQQQHQALGSNSGMLSSSNQIMLPMGYGSSMSGMSAFEPRDPLLGMMGQQQQQQQRSSQTSSMSNNNMMMNHGLSPMQPGSMGGINNMMMNNTMGSMDGGIGSMGGGRGSLNHHGMTNTTNPMNGMNFLLGDSSSGFLGGNNSGGGGNDFEFQRLRQIQQMQLFDRQMNSASASTGGIAGGTGGMMMEGLGLTNNEAPYMNMMLSRQQC